MSQRAPETPCPTEPVSRPLFTLSLALAFGSVAGHVQTQWGCSMAMAGLAGLAWRSRRTSCGSLGPVVVLVMGGLAGLRTHVRMPSPPQRATQTHELGSTTGTGLDPQSLESSHPNGPTLAVPGQPIPYGRWTPESGSRSLSRESERGCTHTESLPFQCLAGTLQPDEFVQAIGPGSVTRTTGRTSAPAEVWRTDFAPDELVRIAPARPALIPTSIPWLENWRAAISHRLLRAEGSLPSDAPSRGLLPALIIGDRTHLDAGTSDLFTRTGTRHLLALSGLHVGLIAWLVVWPLGAALMGILSLLTTAIRRVCHDRPSRRGTSGLSHGPLGNGARATPNPPLGIHMVRAGLVLLMIPLGGGGPAITRAAIALSLAALANVLPLGAGSSQWGRRTDGLSLWGAALSFELLANPMSIGHIGLQLSYLATLGLILGMGPLGRRHPLNLRDHDSLGRPRSPWWRIPLQRLFDITWLGLCASVLAVISTLPVVWDRFGQVAPAGILATLLSLPILIALLGAGWLHALIPAALPIHVLNLPGQWLVGLLELFDGLPGTPLILPHRHWIWVTLACSLGLASLLQREPPLAATRSRGKLLGMLALASGAALWIPDPQPAEAELVLLDVGHGTAALLRVPGEDVWLFDAGSRDRVGVSRAIIAQLREWDAKHLSVVISHRHHDHAGALPPILERYTVSTGAGALVGTESWKRVPIDLDRGRAQLPTQSVLELHLLRGSATDGNEGSRSLEIRLGSWSALLTGDAEQEGLAKLLDQDVLRGPYDLLLLPHHGSQTPHLDSLLEQCRPGTVWISCGQTAALGPELDRRGLEWNSTHRSGALRTVIHTSIDVDQNLPSDSPAAEG